MITKEQWAELEKEMAGYFVSVKFRYQDHTLTIQRVKESESKTALAVYIDGTIKGGWFLPDSIDRPAIIPDVWRKRSKRLWSHQQKAKIIKDLGKRRAQNAFPDIDRVYVYYGPYFTTAKSLVRQFKKLEGIELITSEETLAS